MKAITIYQANDNSRRDTPEQANARDFMIVAVEKIMLPLGVRPAGCEFTNGSGYLQHTADAIKAVRADLIAASRPHLSSWMEEQERKHNTDFMTIHPSWFVRMLDGGADPLERGWCRLACIDSQNREWGQQYYAAHPDEAKQVCLNAAEGGGA